MSPNPHRDASADREIVITRIIDGPRQLVFQAFTAVEHLAQWFGPHGFTTTTERFDFRVGGEWEYVMHAPQGVDYPNWIRWREIQSPERLVFEHGARPGDPDAFESTITFVERDRMTEVTLRSVFNTQAQRDELVTRFGAIEAGQQTLGRLAAYVEAQKGR